MYVREDGFLWQRFCSVLQRFANDIYPCLFSSLACKRMVMELMISWIMARGGSCGDLRRIKPVVEQCAMCKPVVEQWKGGVMTQCVGAAGYCRVGVVG